MKLSLFLLLVVLAAVAAFTALNWPAISTPTDLWLGVATVYAPLGLVLLGMLGVVTALLLGLLAYLQGTALLETRRYGKELLAQRTLADQAEASRFTELRGYLEQALAGQAAAQADTLSQLLGRVDRLEREVRVAVEQSGNSVSAYIGELEDRLETRLPPRLG